MIKKLLIIYWLLSAGLLFAQDIYHETYRPQYHLSPQGGWMGDPNGMIYFNGKYHLLWWGHAISEDLVHWKEYSPFVMKDGPSGFGYWSGCVVVDTENTAGFNTVEDTAMVALYTMHYDNGYEKVGLSTSYNHVTFNYYDGNPVIATDQKDFRDPSVFWHEETQQWIMVIARAIDRSIDFYASPDLKAWKLISNFNTKGAKDQVWEVPDMFKLNVNGDSLNTKWVLTCGMGPNRMQYWVGDFDGKRFTLADNDNLFTGKNVPGKIFAAFDMASFNQWERSGNAFNGNPASTTFPNQQDVNGYVGLTYINSYNGGDVSTGKMVSPEFKIEKPFINFLIGGGNGSGVSLDLVIDGEVVATGKSVFNQEFLRWKGWNVSNWIGKTAHLEIVDNATGSWGHILIDQIVFSDILFNTQIENANWADWGKDFYAARSYRNYSTNPNDRTVWIGWMGNWDYARDVPTTPWKGNQSLPRELLLTYDENGYSLCQKPLKDFETLREKETTLTDITVNGIREFNEFTPVWNVYELNVRFRISSNNQDFGLNLAEDSDGKKLVVGFNSLTSQLYIDRTNTGSFLHNSSFSTIIKAPININNDSILDLHIYMDQSSVEVFANNYHTSISALVFSKAQSNKISFFSNLDQTTILDINAYELNSIWGVKASAKELKNLKDDHLQIYPNPLGKNEQLIIEASNAEMFTSAEIQLFDLFGRMVYHKSIDQYNSNSIQINNVPILPPGQYIFRIKNASQQITKKLIFR